MFNCKTQIQLTLDTLIPVVSCTLVLYLMCQCANRTVYRAMVISLLYAIYQHYIQRTPVQLTLALQLWNTDVSPQIV